MRSVGDLIDCQESRRESSDFQVGNEMGSLEDLIDFRRAGRNPRLPGGQGRGDETI
jgi:hypothetical protein